jgi:hypothetical protein
MKEKRTIKAKDIVNDVRAGLTNLQLMEKYELSPKGLKSIFTKLVEAKAVRSDELDMRVPSFTDTVGLDQVRVYPRSYVVLHLPILDLDSNQQGRVLDLSIHGFQVAGIKCEVGLTMRFRLQPGDVSDINGFDVEAECRWTKGDSPENLVPGFKIKDIDTETEKKLSTLIKELTLGD